MKKVKSGKTIKAFRPKFSVQKKIPFSDPDKVAKKYLGLLMNLISHGRIGYESSFSSKKKEKEKKRKTCSLARSLYSGGCNNCRERTFWLRWKFGQSLFWLYG